VTKPIQQPFLGILASTICIAVSLAICAMFDAATFGTWVTLVLVAMVPGQIILSLVWQNSYPHIVMGLAQPLRGLVLTALMVMAGLVAALFAFFLVGGGVMPPTPYVLLFIIFCVIITFWLVIPMQCWPMTAVTQQPLGIGLGTWFLSYALAYVLFQLFFEFGFLAGTPVFHPELDPQGLYNAWNSLSFAVTTLLVMMGFVLLDFWPISAIARLEERLGKQPLFGIIATLSVLVISALIWSFFVLFQRMDPVVYMVKVPVSMVFGEFIVLVMLQMSPVQNLAQPFKGLVLIGIALLLSIAMYAFYSAASEVLVGGLPAGAPGYQLDLWMASAMLAVTFPMFVLYAEFFNYWPFGGRALEEAKP
jgi:hypothetical protein